MSPPNKPTVRTPGLREVAESAQVAVSSVSRVLSDHPDVSEKMRERVLAAAEELGYEPDILAQSLRRGATLSVGFAVRDISNPVLAEIALGAETLLSEAGYSMLLTNSHGDADVDASSIRLFRRRRVDGLLLSLANEEHEPTLKQISLVRVPIVLIDRQLQGNEDVSAVLSDSETATEVALRAFLEAGHRRIGVVAGESKIHPMRVVESVARRVCADAGAELLLEAGQMTFGEAELETGRLLDSAAPPTALLTLSNQILVGALRAARKRHLRIPDDLSIITFDDPPLLDLLEPPIATISRRPFELGRAAAEELMKRVRGGAAPQTVTVATTFNAGASVAPPPNTDRA